MLTSHGNYKKILKDRITKYGAVEPQEVISNIHLKIEASE